MSSGSFFLYPFYIKPQQGAYISRERSVVSCIRSTSNHNFSSCVRRLQDVVSHIRSTSNHNNNFGQPWSVCVVSHIRSTSNHNVLPFKLFRHLLFPISVLHQTTTRQKDIYLYGCCFPYPFYIKPQLIVQIHFACDSCFPYPFYIKPQPITSASLPSWVVSHIRSTSNHNTNE